MIKRVMGELMSMKNIVVINDEAHHCYREKPSSDEDDLKGDDKKEADKNKKDPKKFCDEISETFSSITKILNLSNNDFIRTTEARHFKSVNEIWKRLTKSGDIYLDKYSGWYSVSDEAYYDKDEIEEINGKI